MADREGNGFLWFLAGLGVGAVVGVLYAPRSGDETRDAIRAKAQEGSERARAQARRAREQASDWVAGTRTGERLGGSRTRCAQPAERAVPLRLRGGPSGLSRDDRGWARTAQVVSSRLPSNSRFVSAISSFDHLDLRMRASL